MTTNVLITGVGGQGTVLASRLIAAAAMRRGYDVRTAETIGMAQRGGGVVSHTRIGGNIHSPLIPMGRAHAMIALEPAEAYRNIGFLSPGGTLIVCDVPVMPAGAASYDAGAVIDYLRETVSKTTVIDGRPLMEISPKTLNVAMLGAAAECGVFPFRKETLLTIISEMPRFKDENLRAFTEGGKAYAAYIGKY